MKTRKNDLPTDRFTGDVILWVLAGVMSLVGGCGWSEVERKQVIMPDGRYVEGCWQSDVIAGDMYFSPGCNEDYQHVGKVGEFRTYPDGTTHYTPHSGNNALVNQLFFGMLGAGAADTGNVRRDIAIRGLAQGGQAYSANQAVRDSGIIVNVNVPQQQSNPPGENSQDSSNIPNILLYNYPEDFNGDGMLLYPKEFVGLGSRFRTDEKFSITFYHPNLKGATGRAEFHNPLDSSFPHSISIDNEKGSKNFFPLRFNQEEFDMRLDPGNYKVVFYLNKRILHLSTEPGGGTEEIIEEYIDAKDFEMYE